MKKDFTPVFVAMLEEIIPNVESYRSKQVHKYNAEKEMEYGGEYSRLEKYKHRVRVVDIFLPTLRRVVANYKEDVIFNSNLDKTIE